MADVFRVPLLTNSPRKKALAPALVNASLLLTTLVATVVSTVQTRTPTYTSYKKKPLVEQVEVRNLLTSTLVSTPPAVPFAKPTPFNSVYKKRQNQIYFPARVFNPQAPIVPPSGLPFQPPDHIVPAKKKIVYAIEYRNLNTNTMDFEPIAASVPESLPPQYKKKYYLDTSLSSLNVVLYNTAQTFDIFPTGGIEFAGSSEVAGDYSPTIGGSLDFTGDAIQYAELSIEGTGSLDFSGTATVAFLPEGSEQLTTKLPMTGAGQT